MARDTCQRCLQIHRLTQGGEENAFMFGCLSIVLAVVCESLAEIRGDVENRPLYVVQDEFDSNTMMAGSECRNVVAHADDAQSMRSLTKPRIAA